MNYIRGRKYNVFPCFLTSTFPAFSNLRSLSRVLRSDSPSSSAASAAGSQGLIPLTLRARINSLSVCGCSSFVMMSLIESIQLLYICFMLLAARVKSFIYDVSHMAYTGDTNDFV